MTNPAKIGVVVIGRNEGERLVACLKSLRGADRVIYVDSGSTDGSVENAEALGASVVSLDMSVPFTAARARNAGAARLLAGAAPTLIQFVDGDCALDGDWLAKAAAFLDANPKVGAVCGRRRELHPEESLYNRLCDIEWDTPVGEANACGGDVLMRVDALKEAGFYNEQLVAGEEPELCLRMRERGWTIWRLDAEMTRHDAAMKSFRQWWTRAKRAGHAYAEISTLHRKSPMRIWRKETLRAIGWSLIAPLSVIGAIFIDLKFLLPLLIYPAQMARLYFSRRRTLGEDAFAWSFLTVIGKFAEAAGAARYFGGRLAGKRSGLFEYK